LFKKQIIIGIFSIFLLLTSFITIPFVFATEIFNDGFELGYTTWSGVSSGNDGIIAINQTIVNSGVNSSKCQSFGNGTCNSQAHSYKNFAEQTNISCQLYVYIDFIIGTQYSYFLGFYDTSLTSYSYAVLGFNYQRELRLYYRTSDVGWSTVTSSTQIALDTQTCIEMLLTIGNNTGTITVWKNDENVTDLYVSGIDNDYETGWGYVGIDRAKIGLPTSYLEIDAFIDDVKIHDKHIGLAEEPEPEEITLEDVTLIAILALVIAMFCFIGIITQKRDE